MKQCKIACSFVGGMHLMALILDGLSVLCITGFVAAMLGMLIASYKSKKPRFVFIFF
jgi:hypothetical protein